jgi:hypothetical protein
VKVTNEVGAKGCHVIIKSSAPGAAPSITVTIQGVDPASGALYTILTSTAIVSATTTVLRVYPGLVAGANIANDVLPEQLNFTFTAANADSLTFSVGLNLIP